MARKARLASRESRRTRQVRHELVVTLGYGLHWLYHAACGTTCKGVIQNVPDSRPLACINVSPIPACLESLRHDKIRS